jgi:hypothetical protein
MIAVFVDEITMTRFASHCILWTLESTERKSYDQESKVQNLTKRSQNQSLSFLRSVFRSFAAFQHSSAPRLPLLLMLQLLWKAVQTQGS